jgi:hypothetical protein
MSLTMLWLTSSACCARQQKMAAATISENSRSCSVLLNISPRSVPTDETPDAAARWAVMKPTHAGPAASGAVTAWPAKPAWRAARQSEKARSSDGKSALHTTECWLPAARHANSTLVPRELPVVSAASSAARAAALSAPASSPASCPPREKLRRGSAALSSLPSSRNVATAVAVAPGSSSCSVADATQRMAFSLGWLARRVRKSNSVRCSVPSPRRRAMRHSWWLVPPSSLLTSVVSASDRNNRLTSALTLNSDVLPARWHASTQPAARPGKTLYSSNGSSSSQRLIASQRVMTASLSGSSATGHVATRGMCLSSKMSVRHSLMASTPYRKHATAVGRAARTQA